MGEETKISWAHDTFNPWWGCVEVSPACDHCYARTLSNRWKFDVWGKDAPRRFFGDKHWNDPIRWNEKAEKAGERRRVFCASMSDIFEDRRDLDPWREKVWDVIEKTPWLDWMLLTKRPEAISRLIRPAWKTAPRKNVWLGTTTENQRRADERIPLLFETPASVYWISAEPLLGPIDFGKFWKSESTPHGIDWVIVGGESGIGARRMDPAWARDVLAQCRNAGASYHFKQKGEILAKELGCKDKAGKDPSEWPQEFQVQEFPKVA